MHLHSLFRYPVKSMAGEPLVEAVLTRDGIEGDPVVQVLDATGRIVTSRTRPRLLGLHASLGPDDEPLVGGVPWTSGTSGAASTAPSASTRGSRSPGG